MKLGLNIISVWFGFIMVIGLVTGAITLMLTDYLSENLYGNKRLFFIVLLFAYSIYRSIRIYQVLKRNQHEA